MWKDLSPGWQAAFEEAWTAFKNGCIPIGAALYDDNGILLLTEHNRAAEADTVNRHISHAEANLLRRLDTVRYNVRTLTLYTTMEPCPMCMGTITMSNIRHVRYAARDPYCGSIHWAEDDPYIRSKGIEHICEGGEAELVQLVIQSCHEMEMIEKGSSDRVLGQFEDMAPKAVRTARALYADKTLDGYAENGTPFSQVYDEIVRRAEGTDR